MSRVVSQRRGVTLIELMVTVAVASVVVSAAIAVFVGMSQQLRRSERRVEATNSAILASSIVQVDLSSTGFRFPNAAFALRHINNVAAGTTLSGPVPVTTTSGCGGPTSGLVVGTDVLQLATGFEAIGPGRIRAVSGSPDFDIVLDTLGEPFESGEFAGPGVNSIVLLSGANQRACLGRVISLNPTLPSMVVRLINRDLNDAAAGGYHPSCPSPGGLEGTRVYRLQRFVRYMVCGPVGRGPEERSLFRQESGRDGVFLAPQAVQGGVEDLQVSVGFSDPTGVIAATGSAASCTGAGVSRVCFCDDATTPSCTLPAGQLEPILGSAARPIDTVNDPALSVMVARARSVRLLITGISARQATQGAEVGQLSADFRRPAAFDHAGMPMTARDGFWRSQQTSFAYFHNFGISP